MSSNVWCFVNLALFWQESYDHGVAEGNPCGGVHDPAESSLCFWEGDGLISNWFHLRIFWWTYLQYLYTFGHLLIASTFTFSHDDQFGEENQKTGRGMNGKLFFVLTGESNLIGTSCLKIKRIKFLERKKKICWKEALLIDQVDWLTLFIYLHLQL